MTTTEQLRAELLIGGRAVESTGTARVEVVSPSTEEVVGTSPDATGADVDRAVLAARAAFDSGLWRRASLGERAAVVDRAAELLRPEAAAIAATMTAEMGVPIANARSMVDRNLRFVGFLAGQARTTSPVDDRSAAMPCWVVRESGGVVAAIAPWNGPFSMAVTKIVPALLAGCSVVFKPAPESPFDVSYLVGALHDAGLPAGSLNVVTGGTGSGRALVAHPDVDRVSFTGSTAAGREIGAVCGAGFKPVHLELGGKSAAIVCDDADPEVVRAGLSVGCFSNTGQVCAALSRVLVPRSRHDEVVALLGEAAASWRLGDPFDPATTMGPLVSSRQLAKVVGHVEAAAAEGASVSCGGRRPDHLERGWFFEPTVLVDVHNEMRVAQQEIFGPVTVVIPYDDVDEAVSLANDSPYGLHGAVFTSDEERALDVVARVRTGTFTVNGFVYNNRAPFGGLKASGLGRDTGREGFESYFDLKTVNFPLGPPKRQPHQSDRRGAGPIAGINRRRRRTTTIAIRRETQTVPQGLT